MLGIIVYTLCMALFMNLLLSKLRLPTIIGYIFTGTIIAYAFNLHDIANNKNLKEIAEFGVVFLMFTIGLDISIDHLNKLKKEVFITGSLQVILTSLFAFIIAYCVIGLGIKSSIIIGAAISLSSTAIVLKTIKEANKLDTQYGKRILSILIMQDIAVIPILLMISFFTKTDGGSVLNMILDTTIAAVILIGLLYVSGRYLLEPFLKIVCKTNSEELFIISVLLLAIGSSYIAHHFGFSYSLGAFMAGLMIAETRFRDKIESDLVPFRDILLGFFFITVGMQIDFLAIISHLWTILILLPILMGLKFITIYYLIKIDGDKKTAFKTACSLIQIGEFSLAILELAKSQSLVDGTNSQILILTIICSMLLTPFILRKVINSNQEQ